MSDCCGNTNNNNNNNDTQEQKTTTSSSSSSRNISNEAGHYVVTAHRPGGVLLSCRCSFLNSLSTDVAIAKSHRLEIRQITQPNATNTTNNNNNDNSKNNSSEGSFPLAVSVPIHGRIVILLPFRPPKANTDYLFLTTERKRYAILSYHPTMKPYPIITHASGSLQDYGHSVIGRECECGPMAALEPFGKCIAFHLYDGFITILPININYDPSKTITAALMDQSTTNATATTGKKQIGKSSLPRMDPIIKAPYHARINERTVLSLTFLRISSSSSSSEMPQTQLPLMPQLAILHQDSYGFQHVLAHSVDLRGKKLILYPDPHVESKSSTSRAPIQEDRLRKNRIDGGSGIILAVPPHNYIHPSTQNKNKNIDHHVKQEGKHDDDDDDQKKPAARRQNDISSSSIMGGLLILGQRQVTYHSTSDAVTKVMPIPQGLLLCYDIVQLQNSSSSNDDDGTLRYLVGDEVGRLHLLSLLRHPSSGKIDTILFDTLGTSSIASTMTYCHPNMLFVGSQFGDSQLLRILDKPISIPTDGTLATTRKGGDEDDGTTKNDIMPTTTTYLSVLEEYTNLGPIVDFDLVPTTHSTTTTTPHNTSSSTTPSSHHQQQNHHQSMVITASGTGKDGSIRLIRNGIGMSEHAAVELGGIKGMWNIRKSFEDINDCYLIQSFVGETRILGVATEEEEDEEEDEDGDNMEDAESQEEEEDDDDEGEGGSGGGGTLEEVQIQGFDPARSTLFSGNIFVPSSSSSSLVIQITEIEVRIIDLQTSQCVCLWNPSSSYHDDVMDIPMTATAASIGGSDGSMITVASANESGQVVVALRGGIVIYLMVRSASSHDDDHHHPRAEITMDVIGRTELHREVSCIDLNPFESSSSASAVRQYSENEMDVDNPTTAMDLDIPGRRKVRQSELVAVGLWDDFTVRLLSLSTLMNPLQELLLIHLGTGDSSSEDDDITDGGDTTMANSGKIGQQMMARSLCLVTLDSSSATASNMSSTGASGATGGNVVDMLLVGLGDGGLVSFAVSRPSTDISHHKWSVHSRKEVSLGTRGITLVPFRNDGSGTCVLGTGDRPTVIYLTGGGVSNNVNPKLCYSNVNLSKDVASSMDGTQENSKASLHKSAGGRQSLFVSVATPFHSSVLFSGTDPTPTTGSNVATTTTTTATTTKRYSLCVSDESTLRLGVIDDIQKLHVTTHRLGMAPRRVVYHEPGRVICVGCIDDTSSLPYADTALTRNNSNMGNVIRFFDDTTFEEIQRIHLDPYEMILSMICTRLRLSDDSPSSAAASAASTTTTTAENDPSKDIFRPYLLVGTAYAYPDEDEPTRGRILVFECRGGGDVNNASSLGDVAAASSSSSAAMMGSATSGSSSLSRTAREVSALYVKGGVYSMCPFYGGTILASINSKTHYCRLVNGGSSSSGGTSSSGGGSGSSSAGTGSGDAPRLRIIGTGHHGHILSSFVGSLLPTGCNGDSSSSSGGKKIGVWDVDPPSMVTKPGEKQSDALRRRKNSDRLEDRQYIAIVGDIMRSISVIEHFPEFNVIEEVARDYNPNWTTAVSMLTEDIYLGGEHWSNLFVLRRNPNATSEEIRYRLDTVGEYHLGEMTNKFMAGSLVMPSSNSKGSISVGGGSGGGGNGLRNSSSTTTASATPSSGTASSSRTTDMRQQHAKKVIVSIGSQTLYATVDGTIGSVLGLDRPTMAFFSTLERSMAKTIRPVGDLSHGDFRTFETEKQIHPSRGFVDGDLVESFLDLDKDLMERVVDEMNRDGNWEMDDYPMGVMMKEEEEEENGGFGSGASGNHEYGNNLTVDDVLAMVEEISMLH